MTTDFHSVPVPSRFVTRVMASIAKWIEEEGESNGARTERQPRPPGTDSAEVWPEHLLRRIVVSQVKSLEILRLLLDLMVTAPGRVFEPHELVPAAEQAGYSSTSMFNAIGKLHPHFKKHFRRDDLPFMRLGEPGNFRYLMTPDQAEAWLAVRGTR